MTPRQGGTLVAAAALLVALVVGACGVPTNDGAERIDNDELPPLLLAPTTTSTTTTTTIPESTTTSPAPTTTAPPTTTTIAPVDQLVVWMVQDGTTLVPVGRTVTDPAALGLDEAVRLLDEGPTPEETNAGITTALLGQGLFRLDGSPVRGDVTVILTPAFFELVTEDQPLAFAQIVYTITGAPNAAVSTVFFVKEEDPATRIQILSGDGGQIDSGQREDYTSITTPTTAPPTTAPPA